MIHRSRDQVVTALVVLAAFVSLTFQSEQVAASAAPLRSARTTSAPALSVEGNEIVDASGDPVQLNGVNRSGAEYMCTTGSGIFDGPTSVAAMATWHVHVVRIPLNEDCWLGINGVNPLHSGPSYRRAIRRFVSRLEANGMNVILDLHWNAPGGQLAKSQREMPDADHSVDFWRSVSQTLGEDPAVLFDLYNEPHDVSWSCWRDGCIVGSGSQAWEAAGMQELIDTVRATGATNILMLGGLGWAGNLTQWHRWMPTDPLHQLVASWHVYSFGDCVTTACWDANVSGVAGAAPILIGEFGEQGCRHEFVDRLMPWADTKHRVGIGYLAWTWNDWPTCDGPTLIENPQGDPTAYGAGVRRHFRIHFS